MTNFEIIMVIYSSIMTLYSGIGTYYLIKNYKKNQENKITRKDPSKFKRFFIKNVFKFKKFKANIKLSKLWKIAKPFFVKKYHFVFNDSIVLSPKKTKQIQTKLGLVDPVSELDIEIESILLVEDDQLFIKTKNVKIKNKIQNSYLPFSIHPRIQIPLSKSLDWSSGGDIREALVLIHMMHTRREKDLNENMRMELTKCGVGFMGMAYNGDITDKKIEELTKNDILLLIDYLIGYEEKTKYINEIKVLIEGC